MGISLYKIKKWSKMLLGNSISHVDQGPGKIYSVSKVRGYYNNLTEKVTKREDQGNSIPLSTVDSGEIIEFSIEIFQYGLGAYDLYLLNDDSSMLEKVRIVADWAVSNQLEDGSYITFAHQDPEHPFSSMAQGEAASLLIRAYEVFKTENYLIAAKKALDYMLIPLEQGGTTKYDGDDIYLYEGTADPLILNGWIFSLWGLWDYCKVVEDEKLQVILDKTISSLERSLPRFDIGYWSMYEDGMRICSPFYHGLHVAQLDVMYELTGIFAFKEYADKWDRYQKSGLNRKRAFIRKAFQKVFKE